jgi:hypothetical protein
MALDTATTRILNALQKGDQVKVGTTLTVVERFPGASKTLDVGCYSFSLSNISLYCNSLEVVSRMTEPHPLDEAEPGEVWTAFHRDVKMIFLIPGADDMIVRLSPRPENLYRHWWRAHAKNWRLITDADGYLA